MLLITSFLSADMPKPKRIKNLLKSVASSDKSVANYVNINATPSTTQDQTRTTSASPFGSPLPQASQSIHQQTSQPTQPQTSQVPQSQASQVPQPQTESELPATSESAPAQPTSESVPERVQPRKSRQSNHYWFVDAIGKIFCIFFSLHVISFTAHEIMYLDFYR